uniref:Uncharacterized protein n=1 Tax=Anguilla anguilla TaxID=7936 RepID=A0A0E9WIP1_ANGAN
MTSARLRLTPYNTTSPTGSSQDFFQCLIQRVIFLPLSPLALPSA